VDSREAIDVMRAESKDAYFAVSNVLVYENQESEGKVRKKENGE
jgi:hypothetical protein